MIDPFGCIDNERLNIIGTVARANPKLKLEVASIALTCFPAAAGISASLYYTNRFVRPECQKLPKKVKILADLLTLTNKRVPDESERQLNGR